MASSKAILRHSVSLPPEVPEDGLEAQRRKQEEFFALAERFRSSTDEAEIKRLGDEMGLTIFGSIKPSD